MPYAAKIARDGKHPEVGELGVDFPAAGLGEMELVGGAGDAEQVTAVNAVCALGAVDGLHGGPADEEGQQRSVFRSGWALHGYEHFGDLLVNQRVLILILLAVPVLLCMLVELGVGGV